MAGAQSATFFFDTNIAGVAAEIQTGMSAIQRAVNKEAKLDGGKVTGNLTNLPRDIALIAERAKVEVGKLNAAFEANPAKALPSGATLQSEYRRILRGVETEIGRVTKGRGLTAEVGLKFNERAIGLLQDQLSRQLQGAFNLAEMTGGTKGAARRERIGGTTLPVTSGTAFTQAQKNTTDADAQAYAKQITDEAARAASAAKASAAARERQAATDEAAARSSADRAQSEEKSAKNAKKAADASDTPAPAEVLTRGAGRNQTPRTAAGGAGQGGSGGGPRTPVGGPSEDPPAPQPRPRLTNLIRTSDRKAQALRDEVTGGQPVADVEGLARIGGSNYIADMRGNVVKIYKEIDDGLYEVREASTLHGQKMEALAAQIRAQSDRITRQQMAVLRAQDDAQVQQAKTAERAAALRLRREYIDDAGQRREGVERVRGAAGVVFTRQQPGGEREFARTESGRGERGVVPVPQNDPDYARYSEIYAENQERRRRADENRQRAEERRTQAEERRAETERARRQKSYDDEARRNIERAQFRRVSDGSDLRQQVTRVGNSSKVMDERTNDIYDVDLAQQTARRLDPAHEDARRAREQWLKQVEKEQRDEADRYKREAEKISRRKRYEDLFDDDRNLREGVERIGSTNKLVDKRGGQGNYQYFQEEDGQRARRIDPDEFQFGKLDRQVKSSEGIFNNFFRGIAGSHWDEAASGSFKLKNSLEGVAQAAGMTAKYSILGTALFALMGAFAAAGQEILDFDDSYADLQVALDHANEGMTISTSVMNSLSDSAAQAGANVGQSMDLAASAVRAFSDETDGTEEGLNRLQTNFAAAASRLAVISNTDIKTAADNLQAIGLAFDIPDASFERINDVIAGAKALGGGNEDDIATGLANIGVQFKELGFTAEETAAIVSKVQAETAQSGTLIASRLTRATSILGGNEGSNALRQLNMSLAPELKIDINADTRTKILQLSEAYETLTQSQRASLINSLGGATAARELIITLENAQDLVKGVDEGFEGKGAEEFQKMLDSINGTIKQIQGEIKGIVTGIATSGVLDPLVLLAKGVLLPLLTGARSLLDAFNAIPNSIQTIIFTLLEVAALVALIKKASGGMIGESIGGFRKKTRETVFDPLMAPEVQGPKGKGPQRINGAIPLGESPDATAPTRSQRLANTLNSPVSQVINRDSSKAAMKGFLGGIKSATSAIGGFNIALGLAALAITAIQQIIADRAATEGLQELNAKRFEGNSQTDFKDQEANFRAAAEKAEVQGVVHQFVHGLSQAYQGLSTGDFTDYQDRAVADSKGLADVYANAQRDIQAQLDKAVVSGDVGAQLDFSSADSLASSLDSLSKSGYTALQIIDGMTQQFDQMVASLSSATPILTDVQKTQVGSVAATAGSEYLAENEDLFADYKKYSKDGTQPGGLGRILFPLGTKNPRDIVDLPEVQDYSKVDQPKLGTALSRTTTDFLTKGVTLDSGETSSDLDNAEVRKALADKYQKEFEAAGLTPEDAKYAAAQTLNKVDTNVDQLSGEALKEVLVAFYDNFAQNLAAAGQETFLNYNKSGASSTRGGEFNSQQSVSLKGQIDALGGVIAGNDKLAAQYEAEGNDKGAAEMRQKSAQSRLVLDQLYLDYAESRISDMEAAFAKDQAGKASEDKMARLQDRADELARQYKEAKTDDEKLRIETEQAQNAMDQLDQRYADAAARRRNKVDPRDETGNAAADVADAQAELDRLDEKNVDPQSEEYQKAERALKEAEQSQARVAAEASASERNVNTRSDDSLQQAKDQLKDDEALLGTMLEGSKEYNEQLNKIMNDKIDLAKAQTETDISAASMNTRSDNSLAVARNNLEAEEARLANLEEGTKEYYDQWNVVLNARVEATKAGTALAISERNLNVLSSSPLDAAQRTLADAVTTLNTLEKGSIEYNNQLAAVNAAKIALANAQVGQRSTQRQLGIDLTNPAQVANEQVTTAREKLEAVKAEAARSNASPEAKAEAIGLAQLELRNAQTNAEAAEFSQFLSNAQNADNLGKISHRAYLNILRGRRERLAAELATMRDTDNGYQQLKDQIQQLDEAIKSGADALSGQFNIGDIRVPTPYEVRKAVKERNTGTVLANNSAQGTAGNVVNDNSQRSVVLNGIPIQQVMTMIEELFGVKTRGAANRKVV